MSTTARIRASIAVICATFALLIGSGLAVRGQAPVATPASGTVAAAKAATIVPNTGQELGDDGGFESD